MNFQFSTTDNGLTKVFDGTHTRIFAIRYRPEIERLISLNVERTLTNQALQAGDFSGADGMHDDNHPEFVKLCKQYTRLTNQIEAEAKRLEMPRWMPYAR